MMGDKLYFRIQNINLKVLGHYSELYDLEYNVFNWVVHIKMYINEKITHYTQLCVCRCWSSVYSDA